jgi:hypothetical protein
MKIRPFWLRFVTDTPAESGATPQPDTDPANPSGAPTEPPADEQSHPPKDDSDQLGDAGKKAIAAERKARRDAEKALATATAKVAEYEQRDMSEAERQAAETEQLRQENARLLAEALRSRVAAAKGVPADLLAGATEDELNAAADRLLEFRGTQAPPDFGAGRRGEAPKPIEALDQQIAEAIKAGNAPRSIALKQQRQALLNIPK